MSISMSEGKNLEKQVIVSALAIDKAVTPDERNRAVEKAYKDSTRLLTWYRDMFGCLYCMFDEASDGVDIENLPTSFGSDDVPIDMDY